MTSALAIELHGVRRWEKSLSSISKSVFKLTWGFGRSFIMQSTPRESREFVSRDWLGHQASDDDDDYGNTKQDDTWKR